MKAKLILLILLILFPAIVYTEEFEIDLEKHKGLKHLMLSSGGLVFLGVTSLEEYYGLLLMELFYAPYDLYNKDYDLFYGEYPFEKKTFLNKENDKRYIGNIELRYYYKENQIIQSDILNQIYIKKTKFKANYTSYKNYGIYISYNFSQNEYVVFSSGIGYKKLSKTLEGLSFHYDIDLFFKPLHFELNYEHMGKEINLFENSYNKIFSSIGIIINRFELKLGYEFSMKEEINNKSPTIAFSIWN